jgi:hypothetical protein
MSEEITHYQGINPALMNGAHHPQVNQTQRRDFGGVTVNRSSHATDALVAKARAEIEARYTMAMHRPRNLDMVRSMLLAECRRPGFAESAIYHKPVGDGIEGLSIRFAEAAARCFTNLVMETSQIYDDENMRILRVTVMDLESNTPWSSDVTVEKTVERKFLGRGQQAIAQRANSYGDLVYIVHATDDQIATKQNAMVSKAMRTLILRVIPGNLQDEALGLCKKVLADKQHSDPNAARNAVFDAFFSLGVTPVNIEEWLGKKLDTATPNELNQLRGLYAAIRDGEASWSDAMEHRREKIGKEAAPAQKGTSAVRDSIRRRKAADDDAGEMSDAT